MKCLSGSATLAVLLATNTAWALSAKDDLGREISLAAPAQRIVSLSPHITELIFAIGAGERIVGRDAASDFPKQALRVPVVGQYGAYNVEAILALKPDLVVAWQGPQAGPALRKLAELGIPVYASQPERIEQIPANLRALAILTGQRQRGEQAAQSFAAGWASLQQRYAQRPQLTVVPQVGGNPAMTVNQHQFTAALFRVCGTRNPFAEAAEPVPLLSSEALLAARPDAIVALAAPAQAEQWFGTWRSLLPKTALLSIDPISSGRPGPRLLQAADTLCKVLDRLRKG